MIDQCPYTKKERKRQELTSYVSYLLTVLQSHLLKHEHREVAVVQAVWSSRMAQVYQNYMREGEKGPQESNKDIDNMHILKLKKENATVSNLTYHNFAATTF